MLGMGVQGSGNRVGSAGLFIPYSAYVRIPCNIYVVHVMHVDIIFDGMLRAKVCLCRVYTSC